MRHILAGKAGALPAPRCYTRSEAPDARALLPDRGAIAVKRVVVPIDGSETSKGVIDYAIYYANREEDAEMLFLHVMTILEHEPVF